MLMTSSFILMSVSRLSSRVANCPQNSKLQGIFRLDTKSVTRSALPRGNSITGAGRSTLQWIAKPATFSPCLQLNDPTGIGAKNCEVIKQMRLFSDVVSDHSDPCIVEDHHDFSNIFEKGELVACHQREGPFSGIMYREISPGKGQLFDHKSKVDLDYDVHDTFGNCKMKKRSLKGVGMIDHPFGKGLEKGLDGMQEGGIRRIIVPPQHNSVTLGYAVYDVKLIKFTKPASTYFKTTTTCSCFKSLWCAKEFIKKFLLQFDVVEFVCTT